MAISSLTSVAVVRGNRLIADAARSYDKSLVRLSSGKQINRASDDPAGSVAVSSFKAREAEINARMRALQQQDLNYSAQEGAYAALSDPLNDLLGLVVSAGSRSTLSRDEREGLQIQANAIIATVDFLGQTSQFKGVSILSGVNRSTLGRITIPGTAPDGSDRKQYSLANLAAGGTLDLLNGDLETAQKVVEAALTQTSSTRASIGAGQRGFDSEIASLQAELENLTDARSRIEDTDYASETANLVRTQVLRDAASYMRNVALDQQRSVVMSLLKGVVNADTDKNSKGLP